MTKKKNKDKNWDNPQIPIENAIGDRAKKPELNEEEFKEMMETPPIPQSPLEIPDEPSPSEMLTLEMLNHQTEARLQDKWPEEESLGSLTGQPEPIIPVSKPDPQPVTKNSSQESPPQEIEPKELSQLDKEDKLLVQQDNHQKHVEAYNKMAEKLGIPEIEIVPAEDVELTALKKYIREDGFVVSTVAFHIVTLCAQPMVTPSTTTWDFVDRASVPEMVYTLLNQPGYLEGIWPSLKIVMADNIGNEAWCAGIATTVAFFDIIRTLPTLKELEND